MLPAPGEKHPGRRRSSEPGVDHTLSPGLAKVAIDHVASQPETFLMKDDRSPGTAAFGTAAGTMGVIQVVSVGDGPLVVRCKILTRS